MNCGRPLAFGISALLIALGPCCAQDPGAARAQRGLEALEGRPQARRLTCESRAAADLLAYHGRPASEAEVFAQIPRSDNPDVGFVGDPDEEPGGLPPHGYGVHAAPVAAALRALGMDAQAVSGRDLAWLREETDEGRPVLVWITGSCTPSSASALVDGGGRPFRAVRWEHVVLVLRVRAGVLVLDPATGHRVTFDPIEFDEAWALFDRAAVSVSGPSKAGVAPEGSR